MRIAHRNNFGNQDEGQSELERYAIRQPEQQSVQEAEAYNRMGPNIPQHLRDLRKINKGIHGIITSIEGSRITVRVISSDLFKINDYVRLDCTPYTKFVRINEVISLDMLMVGERVKAKYLNTNIDKLAYSISEVLSIEVY